MGDRNGEEGYKAAADEGGRADAEGARTREDKDESDPTEAQAQRRGNVSESTGTWRDGGGGSKKDCAALIKANDVERILADIDAHRRNSRV
jgi:hypothetical protein